ncbi:MAG: toll/interleukin-1 receptor domain-containing protein [Chitinophagaceae bacterium]|nr:toll/interleukin-1 receptor domain-containing protein [Chitinophagaceae bacterium]
MSKVFLSYSQKDDGIKDRNGNGWVANFRNSLIEVYKQLFSYELDIYFDLEKIRQGTDWKFNVDKEISDSLLFIAFVSKNYVNSDFCRYEWRHYISVAHQKSRGGEGILPVLYIEVPGWHLNKSDQGFELEYDKQDCIDFIYQYKNIFSGIQMSLDNGIAKVEKTYLDFRQWNSTTPEYFSNLNLSNLQEYLGYSDHQLVNLDDKSLIIYKMLRFSQVLNYRFNLIKLGGVVKTNITNPNNRFIGRFEELKKIHYILSAQNSGAICTLNGYGGLGKTDLALQYAHVYKHEYASGGVWLIQSGAEDNFADIIFKGYSSIYNSFDEMERKGLKNPKIFKTEDKILFVEILKELKRFCEDQTSLLSKKFPNSEIKPSILFIVDNLINSSTIAERILGSIPNERWFNILITTRLKKTDITNSRVHAIDSIPYLNNNESYEIYKSYYLDKGNDLGKFKAETYQQGLQDLINYLSGYPIAVAHTAVLLGMKSELTPLGLLNELKSNGFKTDTSRVIVDNVFTPGTSEDLNRKVRLINEIVEYTIVEFLKTDDESKAGINQLSLLILKYACFLDHNNIDIVSIKNWIEKFHILIIPEEIDYSGYFNEAFINLLDFHILERNRENSNDRIARMHVLVQTEYRKLLLATNKIEMTGILKNMYFSADEEMRDYGMFRIWKKRNHDIYSLTNSSKIIQFALEFNIIQDRDRRELFGFIKVLVSYRLKFFSEEIIKAFESYYEHYKDLLNQPPKEDRKELAHQLYLYSDLVRLALLQKDLKDDHTSEDYITIVNKCIDSSHGSIDILNEMFKDYKPDLNNWAEYGPLMDNLQFDRVDGYSRLGQIEGEVNHNYKNAIEILDRYIIKELDPLFKEKPEAKILLSSMYSVLQTAKSQKANYLIALGKGEEGGELLIDDIDDRLEAIKHNLKYSFSFTSFNALIQLAESELTAQNFSKADNLYGIVQSYMPAVQRNCHEDEFKYYTWKIKLKSSISAFMAKELGAKDYYEVLCDLMKNFIVDLSDTNVKRLEQEQLPYSLLSFTPFVLRDIQFDDKIAIDKYTGQFIIGNNKMLFLMLVMDFYLKVYNVSGQEPINWKNRIDCCSSYLIILKYFGEEEHILEHGIEFFDSLPDNIKETTYNDFFDLNGLMNILILIMDSSIELNKMEICKLAFDLYDQYLGTLYGQIKNSATGNINEMMNMFILAHKEFKKYIS